MAHYYTLNGEPQHTQLTAAGAKNETRPTTSADAKKKGLIPSVTEYLKLLHNHGLERYKLQASWPKCWLKPAHLLRNKTLDEWLDHVTIKAV
jgi:hypothetical protein